VQTSWFNSTKYCCKTDLRRRSLATIRSIAGFMSFEVYSYGSKISMQHAADRIVLFIDWGGDQGLG
jgi:hypothetical protein